MEKLLTRKDVSELLSVTEGTLAVWACTGYVKIPHVKIASAVRYKRESILKFIQENEVN